ncbi:unnamed protein product [Owenia fusiformis]|uniref:Sprouty n=1 Tax=Owenia fusiformis TaxID=6347 RepID=A0A8S4NAH6_OWEFU|nr:unnamed protein product [Owenia fusiformis]
MEDGKANKSSIPGWINYNAAARYAITSERSETQGSALPPSPQRTPPTMQQVRGINQPLPLRSRPNEYVDIDNTKLPISKNTRYGPFTTSNNIRSPSSPIRTQPPSSVGSIGSPKDPNVIEKDSVEQQEHELEESVICRKCGKCKCEQCTKHRKLPERWLFNKKCLCSADRLVNYVSCLCAVECCLYHCCSEYDRDEDVHSSDAPCACYSRPSCCKRWSLMAIMSLGLPCLCCYWPLRGCVSGCTACYNCNKQGCRCTKKTTPLTQRFLLESESSSA